MKSVFIPVAGAVFMATVTGCATAPHVYESELDRAAMSSRIEPQDIRRTVEAMAESLIADPGVLEATGGKRPILDIELMKNRSQLIVDMKSITDSIRTRLIRSRLFRFMDRSTSGVDITMMDEQAQLGLTDRRKAIKPGQQNAAEMFLTGTLFDMTTHAGRVTDRYYKFNMILKDLRTGEIVWSDEQEIRKVAIRPTF